MKSDGDRATGSWWGRWSFSPGQALYWRIGPLELWIESRRLEWIVRRRRGDDPLDSRLEVAQAARAPDGDAETLETDRFAAESFDGQLVLAPRLADRPVVVRPRGPFHILAGTRAELFVSSPVWISIESGARSDHQLLEQPIARPSDTWFGPTTITGEAAYSVPTSCRVDLEGLPVRPHRAVTTLRIDNPGPGLLTFERLAVPIPNLSLFASEDGRLWTEALALRRRDEGGGLAEIQVESGAPEEAGKAERITSPRVEASTSILRVFDSLF